MNEQRIAEVTHVVAELDRLREDLDRLMEAEREDDVGDANFGSIAQFETALIKLDEATVALETILEDEVDPADDEDDELE